MSVELHSAMVRIKMETSDDYVLVRKSGLKSTLLADGHLVVVDESSDSALTLNPLGAAVWEFCDGTQSTKGIVAELQHLCDLPTDTLAFDVGELVRELVREGLLLKSEGNICD